jgi:hypothetical protein
VSGAETWDDPGDDPGDDPAEPVTPALEAIPEPEFPDVVAFVEEFLAPAIRRPTGRNRGRWCPEWFRHEEVMHRLTALWHAWENLRLEGGDSMSGWWLYHLDGHLRTIMDPERGPFQACHEKHSDKLAPLACTTLPPELAASFRRASEMSPPSRKTRGGSREPRI